MASSRSSSSSSSDPESTQESVTATDPTESASAEAGTEAEASTESQDAPYYCPGCGKRVQYQQQCTGKPESPHQPIEVISTDELSGDPEGHTAAPSTENLG